ncbi:protein indeterminate-domain 12-like [Actinidia eriantha]|uniref:protein indeterminate-domain 12-like n=1 Tax=Actinidia eriantha TaxID=165200 RepID=UPI002586B9AC|nr:protein indeterminate-domain 12-like [Actinidia eriantha]
MFGSVMSNNTTCFSHEETISELSGLNPMVSTISVPHDHQQPQKIKKKRNLPGNPDPDAEVIALSPKSLLATNRFVCEICNKGFQRDQNLQLHRRGHNLPWKLKQRNSKENRKRAYVCPEPSCVHHHPSRALGDLTGIKKHFCRKHGEKKWKCDKCSKIYAVQSDWKAHSKTCGTREYRCDCGTLFSRKDSFVTHRAFCDALAEESARLSANQFGNTTTTTTTTNPTPNTNFHLHPPHYHHQPPPLFPFQNPQQIHISLNHPWDPPPQNPNPSLTQNQLTHHIKPETIHLPLPSPQLSSSPFFQTPPPNSAMSSHLSATALLQKAATVGAQSVGHLASTMTGVSPEYLGFASTWQKSDYLTRDFLGLTGDQCGGGGGSGGGDANVNMRNMLTFTGGVDFPTTAYERDHTLLKAQGFGFAEPPAF